MLLSLKQSLKVIRNNITVKSSMYVDCSIHATPIKASLVFFYRLLHHVSDCKRLDFDVTGWESVIK